MPAKQLRGACPTAVSPNERDGMLILAKGVRCREGEET